MRLLNILRLFGRRESGQILVEMLVAVAILGVTAVVFFSGLTTSSDIILTVDEQETAKNIAENQMEYVKNQIYAASYVPAQLPDEYPGYSASISVSAISSRDGNIQKITVIIAHHGEEVLRLEGYKVN